MTMPPYTSVPRNITVTTDGATPLSWEAQAILDMLHKGQDPETMTYFFRDRFLKEKEFTFEDTVEKISVLTGIPVRYRQWSAVTGNVVGARMENDQGLLIMRLDEDSSPSPGKLYLDVVLQRSAHRGNGSYQKTCEGPGCTCESGNGRHSGDTVVQTKPTPLSMMDVRGIFLDLTETREVTTHGAVYMLMANGGSLEFRSLPGRVTTPLEPGNYEESVITQFRRVVEDLLSKKPRGRIAIFDGPPGTGKTYLLRSLLQDASAGTAFVFVKPDDLVRFSDPSILPIIIDFTKTLHGKHLTLFVEDADSCLAPRGGDNMSGVSAVLNLGDGILGELLDIRLVMTTNAKRTELDSAITRPGRLSELVNVKFLPVAQALEVFKRLMAAKYPEDPPDVAAIAARYFTTGSVSLATIYQIVQDHEFKPQGEHARGEKRMGFGGNAK